MAEQYKLEITFISPRGDRVPGHSHRNPDGSVGGLVAENAQVDQTAIIEEGAIVCPNAVIGAHSIIRRTARIDEGEAVEEHRVVW